jgi:hypothetical protein
MQHFLKPASGTAGTEVVAPELLEQLLVAVHCAIAAFDSGLAEGTPDAACCSAQKE